MRLLIFTQKVDKNDPVMGFAHDWVKEFASQTEEVVVICLNKGETDLPRNVQVFSLGKEGGAGKFSFIINLFNILRRLNNSYDRVFVREAPIYFVLYGWYWKLRGIPTYLWYVHRQVDLKLRIAVLFADKVFTSAKESFGIQTEKVVFLGHGINIDKLPYTSHTYNGGLLKIVHVGRITPIKNIETLIGAVSELAKKDLKIQVSLYGDTVTKSDEDYKNNLKKVIGEKGLQSSVVFEGSVVYEDLPLKLGDVHISVNMAPSGGMDKAVLESFALGVPAFASNPAFTGVLGEYADVFSYKFKDSSDLAIKIYNFIKTPNNQEILEILSSKVRRDFSLNRLIQRILTLMN